jgi:hypothetical protein
MGQPDGGWFDEEPPYVIGAVPADKGTNVKTKKVVISFNEFIKVDNPTEKVVISPPQIEMADIKGAGKQIVVQLKDSLKANTTYTIDFSDAISDNSEGNPMGNYTYCFSTGEQIDTMEVSGYVLEAENLEPIKGILVGLYDNLSDTIFTKEPLMRVSRTDSRGRFVIKGVAAGGSYRVYALQDADGNYLFNQKSEKIAFNHDIITPSAFPDTRQDTIWRDSLHIANILRVPYTHFMPDDIVLRAFTELNTDRHFLKAERTEPQKFTLFFSAGCSELPVLKGENFQSDDAFVVESNLQHDTITYWLRDSALINQDTLQVTMEYLGSDTAGVLVLQHDTMEILPKVSYEKRLKQKEKEQEEWKKQVAKAEKKGKTVPPLKDESKEPPKINIAVPSDMAPDKTITLTSPVPLAHIDTAAIHLSVKRDSLWDPIPFVFREVKNAIRTWELIGEWKPEAEYNVVADSAAFTDIYGRVSKKTNASIKVKAVGEYGSLFLTITGMGSTPMVAQLLSRDEKVVKQVKVKKGSADFYYVVPETYYVRLFEDNNDNGQWDTGLYDEDRQPEAVYYYPESLECKAKWDLSRTWNPKSVNAAKQKPAALVKQQAEGEKKTIKRQNYQRAKKMGIDLPEEMKKLDEQLQRR